MDPAAALLALVSIFAIVNPIGNLPTFVALTDRMTPADRARVARNVVLVGTGVLLVFLFVGDVLFRAFNISVPAFRIAGGVVVFKVAFDMIQGSRSPVRWSKHEDADAAERHTVGITPLGVPLYSGPGAITTVMVLKAEHPELAFTGWLLGSILMTFAAAYVLMRLSPGLFRRLGRSGILIFSRVLGLLLAAVGVEFVLAGLREALPALGQAL